MHGDVTVTLDVKDGKLTSFTVEALADVSEGVGVMAVDALPERILNANSIEVDAVAGATVTSEAIMKAAAKALADAGLTNSDLTH
jgi:fumarate reductase flavoprotein subunit